MKKKKKKLKKIYETGKDNQTTIDIKIYEGENQNTKNNHLIGKFYLNNLPKLPAGKVKVEVTFFVDENVKYQNENNLLYLLLFYYF